MRISNIRIERYRAIEDVSVDVGSTTALLGENNAGKSSILGAINLFFDSAPRVVVDDFFGRDVSQPILISVEFKDLTPSELERFSGNLTDGKLRIARKFDAMNSKESGRFFVEADVNPDFDFCRSQDSANPKRDAYKKLQLSYPELPPISRADDVDDALEAWEADHPSQTRRQLVAGFRGFKNVAIGQLREKTDLVHVPAIRDAAEELANEKTSPVKALLNTIARQTIENSAPFQDFKRLADEKLKELTSPEKVPQLKEISSNLTSILARYYADSELIASWQPITELPIAYPKSDLRVLDHKFDVPIEKVGHGLQRAILFSVLEYMATDRATQDRVDDTELQGGFEVPMSDIILVIEEPEIFQHPIKQRLFREAFNRLTEGFGRKSGIRIQIIYTTHSSLLIDIRDFDQLCVVRRKSDGDIPVVSTKQASISWCAEHTAKARESEPDIHQFRRALHIFTPQIAEGFFAKKVVLVEGEGDQALLLGYYRQLGRDPLAEGIYIVNVGGKGNLERPISIFANLGIPTFFVFDNDEIRPKNESAATNKILQRLGGAKEPTDWPAGCADRFAAMKGKVELQVKDAVGSDHFGTTAARIATIHGIKKGEALKSPMVASELFGIFLKQNHQFPIFDEIVTAVDKLTPWV